MKVHIEKCVAHNEPGSSYTELKLVENDCFKINEEPLATIGVAPYKESCEGYECTAMTFKQFAFVDSEDSSNPDLIFRMTCSIGIGEANCLSRKRRSTGKSYGFSYKL